MAATRESTKETCILRNDLRKRDAAKPSMILFARAHLALKVERQICAA
jgi:hypothetical protein